MAGKEPDIGASARTVAANVKRLRGELNYTQLSDRLLEQSGWSINAVGIRRIESGERRVTPDDLVALALALGVTPVTLLMPRTESEDDEVEVTGLGSVKAQRVWRWLAAEYPLSGDSAEAVFGFYWRAVPGWLLGKQVDLVESGVGSTLKRILRRYGSEQVLDDGDD